MSQDIQIKSALISVFSKEGLAPIIQELHKNDVTLYSTGGTEKFIRDLGIPVVAVEDVTSYPSILGGRVKTLHPKIFGGILNRQNNPSDVVELEQYEIPQIDLVIVDLYPFENTVASKAPHQDIIEKIDIGGISLIRAAAKNYKDVTCIASMESYTEFLGLLQDQKGSITKQQRAYFAAKSFAVSSHYDTAIFNYFNNEIEESIDLLKVSENKVKTLRYGENPHQKGAFFGAFEDILEQLHGKELSYNNLLDIDAAVQLISEFTNEDPTFAILKHNNACGLAQRDTLAQAYKDALSSDPTSAFGGVLIANTTIDKATADQINALFCEVVIATDFDKDALEVLKSKKNRILLVLKDTPLSKVQLRTCLNGVLVQDTNTITDQKEDLKVVTKIEPTAQEIDDLLFASKISKHTKSNTIVFAKNRQLIASGTGQTSRVDSLKQAVEKATNFNFSLKGAVMASDAFFPFPDCVALAKEQGVSAVIQPGGSIKDELSINYCDEHDMAMVMTGRRHFKH